MIRRAPRSGVRTHDVQARGGWQWCQWSRWRLLSMYDIDHPPARGTEGMDRRIGTPRDRRENCESHQSPIGSSYDDTPKSAPSGRGSFRRLCAAGPRTASITSPSLFLFPIHPLTNLLQPLYRNTHQNEPWQPTALNPRRMSTCKFRRSTPAPARCPRPHVSQPRRLYLLTTCYACSLIIGAGPAG